MPGYDLYGQYYASARDAENAEMAQCAEIDARLNAEKLENIQNENYSLEHRVNYLEERIVFLEQLTKHLR